MLSSISGQNERWAQLGLYPTPNPPSVPTSGAGSSISGAGSTAAPTGTAEDALPAAGSSAPLSDDMSRTLMALNGSSSAQNTSGTPGIGSPAQAASASDETNSASQLYSEVRSLVASLTGTTNSSAGTPVDANGTDGAPNSGDAMLHDMPTLSSDLTAMASASATTSPDRANDRSPGAAPWHNDISNVGTSTSGGRGGWNPTYSDGFRKQFAMNAYSSNVNAALDSSSTTALTNITA